MENQISTEQTVQPKGVKSPTSAEAGLIWTFLLSTIAGCIYWSVNWKRLGKPQRRWWTILTGLLVFIIQVILAIVGQAVIGFLLEALWAYTIYAVQKSVVPKGTRSITALVFGIILTLLNLGFSFISQAESVTNGGSAPSITIGTSFDRNSSLLTVSGSNLQPNEPLYVRLQTANSFGASQLTIQIEKKDGQGWSVINKGNINISPNENIYVDPIEVAAKGTYRVDFLKVNNLIGQRVFTAN